MRSLRVEGGERQTWSHAELSKVINSIFAPRGEERHALRVFSHLTRDERLLRQQYY